jgi:hypothetical protein
MAIAEFRGVGFEFVAAHPSDKNKSVARIGAQGVVGPRR